MTDVSRATRLVLTAAFLVFTAGATYALSDRRGASLPSSQYSEYTEIPAQTSDVANGVYGTEASQVGVCPPRHYNQVVTLTKAERLARWDEAWQRDQDAIARLPAKEAEREKAKRLAARATIEAGPETVQETIAMVELWLPGEDCGSPEAATPAQASPTATSSTESIPLLAAPIGLGTAPLSDRRVTVAELFDRFPADLAGLSRSAELPLSVPSDGYGVAYGPARRETQCGRPEAVAYPTETSGAPSGWTAAEIVATWPNDSGFAEGSRIASGRDDKLVWLYAERPDDSQAASSLGSCYAMVWGNLSGRWVYTAIAPTAELLYELVAAFVEASQLP